MQKILISLIIVLFISCQSAQYVHNDSKAVFPPLPDVLSIEEVKTVGDANENLLDLWEYLKLWEDWAAEVRALYG